MINDHESLEQRLRDAYCVEPPEALKRRLLAIPDNVPQAEPPADSGATRLRIWRGWPDAFAWHRAVPALSVITAIAVLWVAGLRMTSDDPVPENDAATRIAQEQALRDFVIVMSYLHTSTARANAAVRSELGVELMTAFERGEQSFRDTSNRITNGG